MRSSIETVASCQGISSSTGSDATDALAASLATGVIPPTLAPCAPSIPAKNPFNHARCSSLNGALLGTSDKDDGGVNVCVLMRSPWCYKDLEVAQPCVVRRTR